MFQILLTVASLGQCPNGVCPTQPPPPQPVRQIVYTAAQTLAVVATPKCEQKGLFTRMAERRQARKCK